MFVFFLVIELEMKNKVDELNAVNSKLKESMATLEEKLAKEESEKSVSYTIVALCTNFVIHILCPCLSLQLF